MTNIFTARLKKLFLVFITFHTYITYGISPHGLFDICFSTSIFLKRGLCIERSAKKANQQTIVD